MLLVLLGCILACKLSWGLFGFLIVGVCLQATQTNKPAKALICFALLPFLTILNPSVFGLGGFLGMSARLGMPVMALAMLAASGQRRGRMALPLMGLLLYVIAAIPSSMFGYAPMVSFMKLVNFFFFVLGIYAGTKNLENRPHEVEKLRIFFFALSFFIVVGSMALYLVGSGSGGAQTLRESISTAGGGGGFLCGVVNHSQCLGPTSAIIAGWVLADMLFVEKRTMPGHMLVLILSPVVLYLTQSRTSLLAFVAELGVITTYCLPKFRVPAKLKRRIGTMLRTGLFLLVMAAAVVQVTSGGMKKWLVKHGDTSEEVTVDSLTSSRQSLIQESMADFRQNPLFGKGFQVTFEYQGVSASSFALSAPIEKGFMPAMILGETGVFGMLAFVAFLLMFYTGCRKYTITLALFFTFLVTNLGEATFFSPGGTGGPEWLLCAAGGFVIDAAVLIRRRAPQDIFPLFQQINSMRRMRMPVVRWRMPGQRATMARPPEDRSREQPVAAAAAETPSKETPPVEPNREAAAAASRPKPNPTAAEPSSRRSSERRSRPSTESSVRLAAHRSGGVDDVAATYRPLSAQRPGAAQSDVRATEMRILIVAGSSTREFVDLIEPFLLDHGIRPVFSEIGFAKFVRDVARKRLVADEFNPDVVFVMTSSWNIRRWPMLGASEQEADALLDEIMDRFEKTWLALVDQYRCPIIQNNFEYLPYRLLGNLDEADVYGRICFINLLNECITDWERTHRDFYVNDINRQAADFGLSNWHDLAYWCLYKCAVSREAMPAAAANVANVIKTVFSASRKMPVRKPSSKKAPKKKLPEKKAPKKRVPLYDDGFDEHDALYA